MIINSLKSTVFIAIALCICSFNSFAQSKGNKDNSKDKKDEKTKTVAKKDSILGNKTFIIELTNMDAKKGDKNKTADVIEFKNNKLKSKFFEAEEGFMMADYTVSLDSTNTEEKVYLFTAESKNEEGLTLKWEGTWDGEEISGSASRMKKDKPKGSFEFKGYEKSKKKK